MSYFTPPPSPRPHPHPHPQAHPRPRPHTRSLESRGLVGGDVPVTPLAPEDVAGVIAQRDLDLPREALRRWRGAILLRLVAPRLVPGLRSSARRTRTGEGGMMGHKSYTSVRQQNKSKLKTVTHSC